MSYFSFDAPLSRLTVARAESVNALFQQISDSFDLLVPPDLLSSGSVNFAVAGGTANAIELPVPIAPASYEVGGSVRFIVTAANTGPVTINVGGVGVRSVLRPGGEPLEAGDFSVGQIVDCGYDGSAYRVTGFVGSDLAAAAASAAEAAASAAAVAPVIPYLTDVSDVAAEIASVALVATNLATFQAVAAIAEEVGAVSAISADVQNVNAEMADVQTVAVNIADVNTAAATVTGAGLAAQIGTVAGLSAEVASLGAISADISAVSAIDSDVTTVAANLADVTNYSDTWLGPKAVAPTTRNDGSALVAGDAYFDTVAGAPRYWTGATFIAASGAGLLQIANNLSDIADVGAAVTNLGLENAVLSSRSVNAGSGMDGGGNLTGDISLSLSAATEARLVKADDAVPKSRVIGSGDGIWGGGNLTTNRTLRVDDTVVRTSRLINAGTGLSGGGDLGEDRTLRLNSTTTASLEKADTAVQPTLRIDTGFGISGGGPLNGDREFELNFSAQTSLGKADTAVQPARKISTGSGLTGGGDLGSDRTLSVNSTVVRTTREIETGTGLEGGGPLSQDLTITLAPEHRMTEANVAEQLAKIQAGEIGGTCLMRYDGADVGVIGPNETTSGSNLRYTEGSGGTNGPTGGSGTTWRCMGRSASGIFDSPEVKTTTWKRIS